MTFQEWYAANIEPTLPTDVPEPIRQNARESMAACWNAALDAATKIYPKGSLSDDQAMMLIDLQVKTSTGQTLSRRIKFVGEMRRFTQ